MGEEPPLAFAHAAIIRKLAVGGGFSLDVADLDRRPAGLPPRNPFRRFRELKFDPAVGKVSCLGAEDVCRLLRAIGS